MLHTTLPTVKGQITIPAPLRKKYHITENTPLAVMDNGDGTMKITVMKMIPQIQEDVVYFDNEKEHGLLFREGIDPEKLISLLQEK